MLDIGPAAALVLSVIPPAVFLGISFKLKSDTQVLVAAVMSVLYAFIMMATGFFIIGMFDVNSTMVKVNV